MAYTYSNFVSSRRQWKRGERKAEDQVDAGQQEWVFDCHNHWVLEQASSELPVSCCFVVEYCPAVVDACADERCAWATPTSTGPAQDQWPCSDTPTAIHATSSAHKTQTIIKQLPQQVKSFQETFFKHHSKVSGGTQSTAEKKLQFLSRKITVYWYLEWSSHVLFMSNAVRMYSTKGRSLNKQQTKVKSGYLCRPSFIQTPLIQTFGIEHPKITTFRIACSLKSENITNLKWLESWITYCKLMWASHQNIIDDHATLQDYKSKHLFVY